MNVAVFCSASENVSPMFFSEIELLGARLAEARHVVVYGGANCGCMGALAEGVDHKNGKMIGVVPEMDFMDGVVEARLNQVIKVNDFSERKGKMIELSDAFLIYPGGIGTLDEAFEVLALKSVGQLDRPIFLYNFLNAWDPLLECLEELVQTQMIRRPLKELFQVVDNVEQLLESL